MGLARPQQHIMTQDTPPATPHPRGDPLRRENFPGPAGTRGGEDIPGFGALGIYEISKRDLAGGVRIGLGCQTFQDTLSKTWRHWVLRF